MIATLTSSSSCTIVASSHIVIWKPPSPTTTQTSASGTADLGADRRRQREAHRAEAARRDERARRVVMVVLRLPHLVLADVGHDDGVAVRSMRQRSLMTCAAYRWPSSGRFWMSRTAESPLSSLMCASHFARSPSVDARHPARGARRRRRRTMPTSTAHVLVDLGRVDVDVDLLRVRRVGLQVAGHAIVEPHAERDAAGRPPGSPCSPTPRRACPSCRGSADATPGSRRCRAASSRPECCAFSANARSAVHRRRRA